MGVWKTSEIQNKSFVAHSEPPIFLIEAKHIDFQQTARPAPRGSHYWFTAKAGDKVDRQQPTQFHRALEQLGIELIPAYSPQARGRSERMFKTWQDRLPRELALAGITTLAAANQYIKRRFLPAFNRQFSVPAREPGTAFVPFIGAHLREILCMHELRVVGNDN